MLHFVIIAFFVTRFVHKDWKGLEWKIFDPLIKCGQQSLQYVFCVGIFLSFVAHFILLLSWGSFWAQLGVSLGGIAILTGSCLLRELVQKAGQADSQAHAT